VAGVCAGAELVVEIHPCDRDHARCGSYWMSGSPLHAVLNTWLLLARGTVVATQRAVSVGLGSLSRLELLAARFACVHPGILPVRKVMV
jgi:hypothetical protein